MPTGYTADLPATFREFALRCARAFGALVELRDESLQAPIPTSFKPSPYHKERLAEAKVELAEVEAWSADEADAEAAKAYRREFTRHQKAMQERIDLANRYDAMLEHVDAWTPPTRDHAGMKKFMREQLTESRKYDCTVYEGPARKTGREFKAERLAQLRREIAYNTEQHEKEVARAAERTEWVRALRASL